MFWNFRRSCLSVSLSLLLLATGCQSASQSQDAFSDVVPSGTPVTAPPTKDTPSSSLSERDLPGTNVTPRLGRTTAPAVTPSPVPNMRSEMPTYTVSEPVTKVSVHSPWQELSRRLAADGISGPHVDALLATLPAVPTQSPMGRKMRELYQNRFFPKKPSTAPKAQFYKGVVTEANAALCRDFLRTHQASFAFAEQRYGVPAHIAVSLLFVETRLGKVLADVKENAFYTLASMAVSRDIDDISAWLPRMQGYEQHREWFATTMPKRADWAYKETRALVKYMLREGVSPDQLPSSIYGAIGLCQFMPSNIDAYGADGNGDGKVNLFETPDAIASLANYLYKHGWRAGIDRERQHKLLMSYNHSRVYANTILALSDLVKQEPAAM